MPAFGYDHALGFQPVHGCINRLDLQFTGLPVSAEHRQAGFLPALAGHGPVFAGHMKQNGGLGNIFGIMFGFSGIDSIHDIGIFYINGNGQRRPIIFIFFGHPFTGVHPIFNRDVHLCPVNSMHTRSDFHLPGHETLAEKQPPKVAEHDSGIDAKGTVDATPRAAGAFGIGCIHTLLHKGIVYIPFTLYKLPEGLLDFV